MLVAICAKLADAPDELAKAEAARLEDDGDDDDEDAEESKQEESKDGNLIFFANYVKF